MKQELEKHIVSRSEFRWMVVKQFGIRGLSWIVSLFALMLSLATLGLLAASAACLWYFGRNGLSGAILCLISAIACGYATHFAGNGVARVMDYRSQFEDWVDSTRANIANLPTSAP